MLFLTDYISFVSGNKRYDLVVIGGGSGGLACSKEGKYSVEIGTFKFS